WMHGRAHPDANHGRGRARRMGEVGSANREDDLYLSQLSGAALMRTVLITGGAGFIGSNFVSHLFRKADDYHIIVLDALTYAGNPKNLPIEIRQSPRFEFWHGNVVNGEIVNDLVARSDVVVHF